MINFPINIPVNRPKDPIDAIRTQDAVSKIEEYINNNCDIGENTFNYGSIACATGINESTISDLLMPLDGGHNGITIFKSGN